MADGDAVCYSLLISSFDQWFWCIEHAWVATFFFVLFLFVRGFRLTFRKRLNIKLTHFWWRPMYRSNLKFKYLLKINHKINTNINRLSDWGIYTAVVKFDWARNGFAWRITACFVHIDLSMIVGWYSSFCWPHRIQWFFKYEALSCCVIGFLFFFPVCPIKRWSANGCHSVCHWYECH